MAGSKSRQAGMSIITLILLLALLGAIGAVALQAFPSVLEYQAALKAINRAKNEATVGAARAEIVLSFPRFDVEHGRPRVPSFYGLEFAVWVTLL